MKYLKTVIKKILSYCISDRLFFSICNNFTPIVNNQGIKFFGLFPIPYNRGMTLFSKEPDMIDFIDDHIQPNDVFYDIGANIGVFSLYCALKKDANVYAFEPESSNYFFLNKNISINNLNRNILAFNIAINDTNEISTLNLKENIVPGKSGNTFNENINENQDRFFPKFKQGMVGISLDTFVYTYNQPCPNHIKIDVDGNEYKILKGMKRVLNDKTLQTIAVEVNLNTNISGRIKQLIKSNGFRQLKQYRNRNYEKKGVINYFFHRV